MICISVFVARRSPKAKRGAWELEIDDLKGRVLDRKYRLMRLIGEGGMGTVWEAEHTMISRKAAVKVMHRVSSDAKDRNRATLERFIREAQAASAIGHPNIIEIYDVGTEEDGTTFIVMELLKGISLSQMLDEQGSLSPRRTVVIIMQVLSALLATHRKGIIHRDLKPDNIYIAVDQRMREEVKLLDFGVAKMTEDNDEQLSLTKTGSVLGTPYYLAPEQARGSKDIDARIDIWSAGIMMYEMLTGVVPFEGENYNEVLGKILMEEVPSLEALAPETPEPLLAIVDRALAKDRELRYRDVGQMLDDLYLFHEEIKEDMPTSVIRVLRQSIAPPPPSMDPRFRVVLPEGKVSTTARMPRSKSGRFRDEPTSPLENVPGAGSARSLSTRSRTKSVLFIGGGIVGAVLAVVLIVIIGSSDGQKLPAGGAEGEMENAHGDASIGAATAIGDTVGGAIEPPVAPAETTAKGVEEGAGETEGDLAAQPLADSSTITIELKALPPRARAWLNGKPVRTPLTVARSDRKGLLRITAPGHFPYVTKLALDRDQDIPISMRRRGGSQKDRDEKDGDKDPGWKPNPFDK